MIVFKSLFGQGIQLVYGLKAKMKNKLMPMWDKIMLRKRYIIECINELFKNKANIAKPSFKYCSFFLQIQLSLRMCSAYLILHDT